MAKRTSRLLTGLAVVAVSLSLLAGVAGARSPAWTAQQMESALVDPAVTLVGASKHGFQDAIIDRAYGTVSDPACRGLGSRTHAGFSLFRCRATYTPQRFEGGPYPDTLWARPWAAGSVCITDVSLGTCPPPLPRHPLRGDPRRCLGHEPVDVGCIAAVAGAAAGKGQTYVEDQRCFATAVWTTYICRWNGGSRLVAHGATVRFVRHPHSWTTSVKPR